MTVNTTKRTTKRYGWLPDLPDQRNYIFRPTATRQPTSVDWRPKMQAVYDQGQLGSCTANAVASVLEYLANKEGKADFVPSRLFIYYFERFLENSVSSDSGAMLSDGIKVAAKYGAPHETVWPYNADQFATKPSAEAISNAIEFKALQYQSVRSSIVHLKAAIVQGPVVFGFTVYESFESDATAATGVVTYPKRGESVLGGHAVVAVGYDDSKQVAICRNSWSKDWGDKGYFYIPYKYITNKRLASDFWLITKTS